MVLSPDAGFQKRFEFQQLRRGFWGRRLCLHKNSVPQSDTAIVRSWGQFRKSEGCSSSTLIRRDGLWRTCGTHVELHPEVFNSTAHHEVLCPELRTVNRHKWAYRLGMNTILFHPSVIQFTPILAQAAAGGLAEGASKAMGIVMLIGFIFGTICVIGGGFAIRRGDTDAGKLSIIGGLIIAGAPVIVRALFAAFGNEGSTVEVGAFQ